MGRIAAAAVAVAVVAIAAVAGRDLAFWTGLISYMYVCMRRDDSPRPIGLEQDSFQRVSQCTTCHSRLL